MRHSVETALTGESGFRVSPSLTGDGGLMMSCELGTIDSMSFRCAGECKDAPMKKRYRKPRPGALICVRIYLDIVVCAPETDERVRRAQCMVSGLRQLSSYALVP